MFLGVESCFRRQVWRRTRMKNADWLDVAVGCESRTVGSGLRTRAANQRSPLPASHSGTHHDICESWCLSKIAHMEAIVFVAGERGQSWKLQDAWPGLALERAFSPERRAACSLGKSNSRPQSKQTRYVRSLIVNTRLM